MMFGLRGGISGASASLQPAGKEVSGTTRDGLLTTGFCTSFLLLIDLLQWTCSGRNAFSHIPSFPGVAKQVPSPGDDRLDLTNNERCEVFHSSPSTARSP